MAVYEQRGGKERVIRTQQSVCASAIVIDLPTTMRIVSRIPAWG